MANVQYEIETLISDDNRLNEIPIKVIVKNLTEKRIKILSIIPNMSNAIELEEKADTFQEESKKRFNYLCQELSFIVDTLQLTVNSEFKESVMKVVRSVYFDFFKDLPKLYKLLLLDRTLFNSRIKYFNTKLSQTKFHIQNLIDAKWAYKKWIEELNDSNPQKKLYEGKLLQLENISNEIGKADSSYIALIEPGSFYSRTYVLRFYRNALSTKVYNISFDSKYSEEDIIQEYRANVSTSINISPKPLILNIFVVLASVLGTILKYCMTNLKSPIIPTKFFVELGNTIITGPGIISIIVAVLFFNIYEFTDIGKKMKISINWRAALTIGILAGLLGDRLIEAVKVFIGLN